MPLAFSPHPILKKPTAKEQLRMGPDKLLEFFNKREAAIFPKSSIPTTKV
tara:strand:- start:1469 stop:1618 length:150 start_codon:yes stop_codon:yes gene_type:complete